jgi:hypothetical protein
MGGRGGRCGLGVEGGHPIAGLSLLLYCCVLKRTQKAVRG